MMTPANFHRAKPEPIYFRVALLCKISAHIGKSATTRTLTKNFETGGQVAANPMDFNID